jgi:chromosome segregation ATPase
MKNFQQNLLITLALALCGLCVFQWYDQTTQRGEIQTLNGMVYQRDADIQNYTNSLATQTAQINRMDAQITELKAAAETNAQLIASEKHEIGRLQFTCANLTNEISQYQAGVETLQAKLKEAYDGISKQNGIITNLVAQRDDLVKQYNDSVKDRNDVVAKYNELAKQVEKLQANGDDSPGK